MSKEGRAAETFSAEEADTAQRGYPQEVVDGTKRTARMPRVELETILKTKSGTRPVASGEDIAEHVRERLSSVKTPFVELTPQALESMSSTLSESLAMSAPRAPSIAAPAVAPRSRAALLAAAFVLVALVSGAIGFLLGRLHHHG